MSVSVRSTPAHAMYAAVCARPSAAKPLLAAASAAPRARAIPSCVTWASAANGSDSAIAASSRRGLLAGLAVVMAAPAARADILSERSPTSNPDRWDGYSSGLGSCPLGKEGDQCRLDRITNDTKSTDVQGSYKASGSNSRTSGAAPGLTVGSSEGYAEATTLLIEKSLAYLALEPFDKQRPALQNEVKTLSNIWVGKYAPGGATKSRSAGLVNTGINALLGHFSFNGLAPVPKGAVAVISKNLNEAKPLVAAGK